MDVSIILPTLNEAKNIETVIRKIESVIKKNNLKSEIIVVDDNSPDGTADIAKKMNKRYHNIKTLVRKIRNGAGAATLHGYRNTKGKIIITMESDDSCDPEDIPKIIDKINSGCDIVIASYHTKGARTNKQFLNKFASKMGNIFIALISGMETKHFTMIYRGFRREILDEINCIEKDGNAFYTEFIIKANKAGYKKIVDIPTHYKIRKFGVSKNPLPVTMLKVFKSVIKMRLAGN